MESFVVLPVNVAVLTENTLEQMLNGETKGLTGSEAVGRSSARSYNEPLLPLRFSDEIEPIRLWFVSKKMPFLTWFLMSQKNGWINVDGLRNCEILDRLETICNGNDDKWAIRTVEFTESGKLLLWVDDVSKLGEADESRNCLSIEIGEARGLAIQLRQSRSSNHRPYCKSLIKIAEHDGKDGREWIFSRWTPGYGHELYRLHPDCQPLRQTIEYYPPHVDLLIENL